MKYQSVYHKTSRRNGIVSLLFFVLTFVTFTYLLMYLSSVVTWFCQYFSVLYYWDLIESLVFVNPFSMPPNSCLLLKSAFNLLNIIAILWLYLNYCRVTLTHQQTNAKLLIFFFLAFYIALSCIEAASILSGRYCSDVQCFVVECITNIVLSLLLHYWI